MSGSTKALALPEVVVVGAGPVGLWTALQVKKRSPATRIVVYERHAVYQRHHVLRLDPTSLLWYGRQHATDPLEQAFYQAILGRSRPVPHPGAAVFVRTHDLEAALRTYALALGIEVRQERIEDPLALMARHPGCAHFIAADGARSAMRQAVLGETAVSDIPLQRVVELKYQVEGTARRLKASVLQGALRHMAFEYVGKPKAGHTAITVRLFLDEATFAALPPSSFKAPLSPSDPRLPPALAQDLAAYLALRPDTSGCLNEARLSALTLSMYAASTFALQRGTQAWFLVGDAAMGVPYFRALNSGLILGSRLAQILAATTWPVRGRLDRQVRLYQAHRPLRLAHEFALARGKDMALRGWGRVRQWPMPWVRRLPPTDGRWAWGVDCRDEASPG